MEARYLYRGTTEGWPGNAVLQTRQITCTTTDPFVAALFAIECRNHGHAVVLAARRDLFKGLIAPRNHFDILEYAVNVRISPLEFARQAVVILDVDEVVEVLREIGFDQIPIRIGDKWTLRQALLSSKSRQRLNMEQIRLFNLRAIEAKL
jgi:hypothetical protein